MDMVRYSLIAETDFKAFDPKGESVPAVRAYIKCLLLMTILTNRSQLENYKCDYL